MLYLLDTANISAIQYCNEYYPLAGVTTNPTIITRENGDFWQIVKEIRQVIGEDMMLHVQTTQKKADKIVEEALLLYRELQGNFYIKIPISEEGLKATKELKKLGIKVTVTTVFTPAQALLAAMAGADFVAPYVNRLDNILGDGIEVVAETIKQFKHYNTNCQVLAASFKNAEQVHKCASAGCNSVTISAEILKTIISHPMSDAAVAGFDRDWASIYGDKTILDLERR